MAQARGRRAAGVGVGLAALVVAGGAAWALRAASTVRTTADRAAATAASDLSAALGPRRDELKQLARQAAALLPLRQALAGGVDVYTLLDLFESEDWWAPWRSLDVAVLRDGRLLATRGAGNDLVALGAAASPEPMWGVTDATPPREAVAVALEVPRAKARFTLLLGRALAVSTSATAIWRAGAHTAALTPDTHHEPAWPREPWASGMPLDDEDRRADLGAGWVAARVRPNSGVNAGELWAISPLGASAPPPFVVPLGFALAALLAGLSALLLRSPRTRAQLPPTEEAPPKAWSSPPVLSAAEAPALELRRGHPAAATAIGPGGGQTFGRYTLIERIGEGGMSEIYSAVLSGAEGFERLYVVKRLKPELAMQKGAIEQFIDEAKLGSMLVHSNIVPVLDFGKIGDGYFLAAEYIAGRNLAEVVDVSVQRTGAPLPPVLAGYVAHEVLEALAYAHEKADDTGQPLNIVHRDVSPANVMATAQGEVKLLDFGIVKAEQRKARTDSGNVKGNASFMSPEQARGQRVDGRSDLFALGLVLYYLVTGEPLYPGSSTAEVFYRAATGPTAEELARLRRLPAPLDQLVERALAIDPAARFPTARHLASELSPCVPGSKAQLAALMDALFRDELRRPIKVAKTLVAKRI